MHSKPRLHVSRGFLSLLLQSPSQVLSATQPDVACSQAPGTTGSDSRDCLPGGEFHANNNRQPNSLPAATVHTKGSPAIQLKRGTQRYKRCNKSRKPQSPLRSRPSKLALWVSRAPSSALCPISLTRKAQCGAPSHTRQTALRVMRSNRI